MKCENCNNKIKQSEIKKQLTEEQIKCVNKIIKGLKENIISTMLNCKTNEKITFTYKLYPDSLKERYEKI